MSTMDDFPVKTHALVRYSDDKLKTHVINVKDIYKFDCKKGFDDSKPYVMKWFCAKDLQQPNVEYDGNGWDMQFYMGEVYSVGTKEEMLKLKKSTIRWKKLIGVLTPEEERRQYNKPLKTYGRKTSSTDKESKKEKESSTSSKKVPTKLVATDSSKKINIANVLLERKNKQSSLLPNIPFEDQDLENQNKIRRENSEELQALRTEIQVVKKENENLRRTLHITQTSLESRDDQLTTLQLLIKYQEDKLKEVPAALNAVCKKCQMVPPQPASDIASTDDTPDINLVEVNDKYSGAKLVIDEESRDSNMSMHFEEVNIPIKTEATQPDAPSVMQSTPAAGVASIASKKRSAKAVKDASEIRPYNMPGFPPIYEVKGANIHLVNGIYIQKNNWDLLKNDSPSMFANKLFQAFHTSEEMTNLSWSGLNSPRNVKSGKALQTVGVSDIKKKALLFLMESKLERENIFNDKDMMRKHARSYVINAVSQKSSNKRRKLQPKKIVVKIEKVDEDDDLTMVDHGEESADD